MQHPTVKRILAAITLALITQAPGAIGHPDRIMTSSAGVSEDVITRPGGRIAAGSSWNGVSGRSDSGEPGEGTLDGGINAI